MGRKKRNKIEHARIIAWYDFIHAKTKKLWNFDSEYQFYKKIYQDTGYEVSDNIFKKYKFGLSTPQKAWLDYADMKAQDSKKIFDHPIWTYFNNGLDTEASIIKEMHQLPIQIRELIIEEDFGAPTPTSPNILKSIISHPTIDNFAALYLLYCWGEIINNSELSNLCADLIANSFEQFLTNTPYLRRAHILLFDEVCARLVKRDTRQLTITNIEHIKWRELRSKSWALSTRLSSFSEEIILLSNAKLANHRSSEKNPISIIDCFYLTNTTQFENTHIEKRFKRERENFLKNYFSILK